MVIHHFTLLVSMVTSTSPSTSLVKHNVIHHVRTMMVIHHFTMLVTIATLTLRNTYYPLVKWTHWLRIRMAKAPVDYASRQDNSYDLLKLFQSFPQCEKDFPVHTYTKLILTGYSGAGKTTISQLILLLASKPETGFFSWLSSGRVTDVECLTAGIIPLHVESKVNEVGNMVIYDFAGQQEYYSSHAAVLERIMRNSAAIFVCIVGLNQCMDKISESIYYWINFIENACHSAQGSSHVIIVGSHADLVKSSRELKEKSSLVESIAESRAKQLTYGGFVSMDCRMSKTKEARLFCSLLFNQPTSHTIIQAQHEFVLSCIICFSSYKAWDDRLHTARADLCPRFRERLLL